MMVRDDQIHAQALRGFSGREGTNAHVHADDQANARSGGALDHIIAQIVAFADAMREHGNRQRLRKVRSQSSK